MTTYIHIFMIMNIFIITNIYIYIYIIYTSNYIYIYIHISSILFIGDFGAYTFCLFNIQGACNVTVIVVGGEHSSPSLNTECVCISHNADPFRKTMNPTILSLAMDKLKNILGS